jgi:hypothetical protein
MNITPAAMRGTVFEWPPVPGAVEDEEDVKVGLFS